LALWTSVDQQLDALIDLGDEGIEVLEQLVQGSGQSGQAVQTLLHAGAAARELGTAHEQALQLAQLGAGRMVRMQIAALAHEVAGDHSGVDTVGLGAQTHALGVAMHVLGVEHIDQHTVAVGQIGEQFVVGAGGFHADGTATGQALEPD
jgi:hypothetical protein